MFNIKFAIPYHILFVLKTLNFLMDLNSSRCGLGTWATSSKRSFPSYSINVPPFTSALVLLVTYKQGLFSLTSLLSWLPLFHYFGLWNKNWILTSIINSFWFAMNWCKIDKSTVAPMLSMLDMKQTDRPSFSINSSKRPELANAW